MLVLCFTGIVDRFSTSNETLASNGYAQRLQTSMDQTSETRESGHVRDVWSILLLVRQRASPMTA